MDDQETVGSPTSADVPAGSATDPPPPASPDGSPDDATSLVTAAPPEPSPDAPPPSIAGSGRGRRSVVPFAAAFVFGLLAVLTVSAGALAAYESSNDGRILSGIHAGSVDLSGLTPSVAAARLRDAYASLGDGQLVLSAAGIQRTVTFADLGRRVDADRIVAVAMSIGREGPVMERIAANIRMFVRGTDIAPFAVIEEAALRKEMAALATAVGIAPMNAGVTTGETGFALTPGSNGRLANVQNGLQVAEARLIDPAAPSSIRIDMPTQVIEPDITTDEAASARDAAIRIAVDTTVVGGSETWTISAAQFRGWISFGRTAAGGYAPIVARDSLTTGLAALAGKVAIAPIDATYLWSGGKTVVGVTDAVNGRALDVPATVESLVRLVQQRADGLSVSRMALSVAIVAPSLTTAEASKTAPLMKPISEWTTIFPIGIANGYGVNIWIPARALDGYVVLPGQWFDFWQAIGPVTREAGYRDGGVIINGRSEPTGALAGGICSASTTMFNAALRAGLEIGARANHFYYIDRYPLGLDATVFQSSSGSIQTMSFRNDTANPILIRGSGWGAGSTGYVKFVIWSVPTGRTVTLSTPIVKNVLKATDTTVTTTDLKPGVQQRVEYPTDGKDVWVTRTVTNASGAVIHTEEYYSHYARITGVVRIGTAPVPVPAPTPIPASG